MRYSITKKLLNNKTIRKKSLKIETRNQIEKFSRIIKKSHDINKTDRKKTLALKK